MHLKRGTCQVPNHHLKSSSVHMLLLNSFPIRKGILRIFFVRKKNLWIVDVVAMRHLKEICMECDALDIARGISSHLAEVVRCGLANFWGFSSKEYEDHYKGKLNSKCKLG